MKPKEGRLLNPLEQIWLMGQLQLCYADLKGVCEQPDSTHRAKLPVFKELLKAGNNRAPFTPTEMADLWVDCALLVGSVCSERVTVFVKEKKKTRRQRDADKEAQGFYIYTKTFTCHS